MYPLREKPSEVIRCIWCGRLTYNSRYCIFCGEALIEYELLDKIKNIVNSYIVLKRKIPSEVCFITSFKASQLRFLSVHLKEQEASLLHDLRAGKRPLARILKNVFKLRARLKALHELIRSLEEIVNQISSDL